LRSIALRVIGLARVFYHLPRVGISRYLPRVAISRIINFSDEESYICNNLPDLDREPDILLVWAVDAFRLGFDQAIPAASSPIWSATLISARRSFDPLAPALHRHGGRSMPRRRPGGHHPRL
jgi:hypothetical protein